MSLERDTNAPCGLSPPHPYRSLVRVGTPNGGRPQGVFVFTDLRRLRRDSSLWAYPRLPVLGRGVFFA